MYSFFLKHGFKECTKQQNNYQNRINYVPRRDNFIRRLATNMGHDNGQRTTTNKKNVQHWPSSNRSNRSEEVGISIASLPL